MAKREEYLHEIREIAAANGGFIKAEDVVRFAKNPTTALHSCFTWDDNEAAKAYRLHEARAILRVVVAVLPGDDPLRYRATVSLKEDRYNGVGYRIMADVLTDSRLREVMLVEALAELQVFMAKYEGLKELASIFEAMSKIVKTKPRKSRGAAKYKQAAQPTA
jgi:hypothetical protein